MNDSITSNLLNSENKKDICNIIKKIFLNGGKAIVHLAISKTNQKPLIILYKSDGTKTMFSLEENVQKIVVSEYEVIVIESIVSIDDIGESADYMIGTYNGYFS